MAEKPEILIIGGGVIGVCAAYYLAQMGRDVTLVERGAIGKGSSYGNAGIIAADHGMPMAAPGVLGEGLRYLLDPASPLHIKPRLDPALWRWLWRFRGACRPGPMHRAIPLLLALGGASLEMFADLAAAGLAFAYEHKGRLHLYRSAAALEKEREEIALLARYGVSAQLLDGAEVRARAPEAAADLAGGAYFGGYAHCDPYQFVREMARVSRELGATLIEDAPVTRITRQGRRITEVQTTQAAFAAEQVVLAAGAWSPALARMVGVRLLVEAAKGYSITAERPAQGPDIPLGLGEAKVAVTPMGDRFRYSSTLELAGLDTSINQRRVAATRKALRDYLPGLAPLQEIEVWQGPRPATPDALPLIGRSRQVENLIVATGHGMFGVTQGPVTGRIVAQLAAGQPAAMDLAPFAVERFG